jgi:hypothetical protein
VQNVTTYFQETGVRYPLHQSPPATADWIQYTVLKVFKYHYKLVFSVVRHFGPKTEKVKYKCHD